MKSIVLKGAQIQRKNNKITKLKLTLQIYTHNQ